MEVIMKAINADDLTVDILAEVANQLFKDELEPKQEEQFSLSEMKRDLKSCNELAKFLSKKIREEEQRRKKETHHLIEKKVRRTIAVDEILYGTDRETYTTEPKRFQKYETLKYIRKGNTIECILTTVDGRFKGVATRHEEDEFDYKAGMSLARIRAMKNMYTQIESKMIERM